MPLLSVLLLASGGALAGARTVNSSGMPIGWQVGEISFAINPNGKHGLDPDKVTDAILAGAEEWMLEDSWITLDYTGETSEQAAAYKGSGGDTEQVIFFADEWNEKYDANLLALTYVWSDPGSGEILHFDIEINADDHTWGVDGDPEVNDLWNAMSHEFGHALGFDHSDDGDATMYSKTSVGELAKRDLAQDDLELYTSLYGGTFPYEMAGRMSCSASGSAAAGWGVLVGMMALVGRRRHDNKEL